MRPDMELGHILWPSDPGIQRPGDPVDPVTLFYNELQMSTKLCAMRFSWCEFMGIKSLQIVCKYTYDLSSTFTNVY